MITGIPSLLLHLSTIFGVFLFASAVLLTLLRAKVLKCLDAYAPAARRSWLWLLALLPWLTAFVGVILVMLPSIELVLFSACPECHIHDDGLEHLCWYHPLSFQLLSWQGALLSGMALFFAQGLVRTGRAVFQLGAKTQRLLAFAEPGDHGYTRLDSDLPCAVTLGLLRPRSLITSAIEKALDARELAIVVSHEREHVHNHDPLKQYLYRLLTFILPTRAFIDAMELATEQCADLAVTRTQPDRALIAATILKVRRINESSVTLISGVGVTGFGTSILERRITLLLSRKTGARFPTLLIILIAALIIGAGLLSGSAPHNAVEFLLAY